MTSATTIISRGRDAFFFGTLMEYRQKLGLSKQGLADILGVSTNTLYRWDGPGMLAHINDRNAAIIDEFCAAANLVLQEYPDFAERFLTVARSAQWRGVTQEWMFERIREGTVDVWDFGFLGLFVQR
jgi:hypothetical protein